jgi:transcriptional regulator with XRE-family HTH domain
MPKTAGRPFATTTKLGALMDRRGLRAIEVAAGAGVYPRTLTEILAGRKAPTPQQLAGLTRFLRVPPEAILETEMQPPPARGGEEAVRRVTSSSSMIARQVP